MTRSAKDMNVKGLTFFLLTKNYGSMKQFFADLGFDVPSKDHGFQITPAFNQGRGCVIPCGTGLFCLEECTDTAPSGSVYFEVGQIDHSRLPMLKSKYPVKDFGRGFSGDQTFQIVPPDGGIVVFATTS